MTELNNLRILHLTSSFPLTDTAISGIFIHRMIASLPPEVHVMVLTPDSRFVINRLPGNYKIRTFRYALKQFQVLAHEPGGMPTAVRLSSGWALLFLPSFLCSMLWQTIFLARKSDVIHAHWTLNGVIACLAGRLTRKPVVVTLRGDDVNRANSSLMHRCLLNLCLKLSDEIVTVSSAMQEAILSKFNYLSNKISFIPNGINDELFAIQPTREYKIPVILVLGSLVPVKGIALIIQALGLCCMGQQWKLLIAGEGPEKEKLHEMAVRGGTAARVQFLGQVRPADITDLLSKTNIFIQASYREGRPNAVLEAMAAGIPVIGSDIDGINELINHGENGLLFPSGNVQELSKCILSLLGDPILMERLGQAGRQSLLKQQFTWPKCASSYVSVYNRLVEGN